jgi:hypothetical protein
MVPGPPAAWKGEVVADDADEHALYLPDGDGYVATERTQGAWNRDAQNGGAILSLLGHRLEDVPTLAPMEISRLTFDLIRPAPIGPRLDVHTRVVREGKKIQLVEIVLAVGDVEHVRGQALRLRVEDITDRPRLPGSTTDDDPVDELARPEDLEPMLSSHVDGGPGFLRGIELRRAHRGGDPDGPFGYWVRLRGSVIAGLPVRPTSRLAMAIDFANTIGVFVEPASASTINPDVSAHVLRLAEGEWIGIVGETRFRHESGRGISTATLSDLRGPVAFASTSQIVQPV